MIKLSVHLSTFFSGVFLSEWRFSDRRQYNENKIKVLFLEICSMCEDPKLVSISVLQLLSKFGGRSLIII